MIEVKCDYCGELLELYPCRFKNNKHHFCDGKCYGKWQSKNRSGKNNSAWKGGKVKVICACCGIEYEKKPSHVKGSKYCSRKCSGKGSRKRVEVKCEWCGEQKFVTPSMFKKNKHHYCGRECFYEWLSKNKRSTMIEVICAWCGKQKFVKPSQFKRNKHNFFCNHKCLSKGSRKRVEVKCAWCGKPKLVSLGQFKRSKHHFCDRKCKGRWQTENLKGANNSSWRGGKITINCAWCGKEKMITPACVREKNFCDRKCQGKYMSKYLVGKKATNYKEKILVKCFYCGKDVYRYPSRIKEEKKYTCSKCHGNRKVLVKCKYCGNDVLKHPSRIKAHKNHFCNKGCFYKYAVDKNSSNWKGGKSFEPYSIEFNDKFRKMIRDRDNRVCQWCGLTEEENGQRLAVHHLHWNKMNVEPEWFVSLCKWCHDGHTHFMREFY